MYLEVHPGLAIESPNAIVGTLLAQSPDARGHFPRPLICYSAPKLKIARPVSKALSAFGIPNLCTTAHANPRGEIKVDHGYKL